MFKLIAGDVRGCFWNPEHPRISQSCRPTVSHGQAGPGHKTSLGHGVASRTDIVMRGVLPIMRVRKSSNGSTQDFLTRNLTRWNRRTFKRWV